MVKTMTFVGTLSMALTLSTSVFAAEAGGSGDSVWPGKTEVMAHLKKVGPTPQTDPAKGLVYYKCGYNPSDVLTGEAKKQSSQEYFDYYAITQVTRKGRDPEVVGLKLLVGSDLSKVTRYPDGGHTTTYYSKVKVERVLNSFGPGYNLGGEDELLSDLNSTDGFSGSGELALVTLGYRERSRCVPASYVGSGELRF